MQPPGWGLPHVEKHQGGVGNRYHNHKVVCGAVCFICETENRHFPVDPSDLISINIFWRGRVLAVFFEKRVTKGLTWFLRFKIVAESISILVFVPNASVPMGAIPSTTKIATTISRLDARSVQLAVFWSDQCCCRDPLAIAWTLDSSS